MYVNNVLLQRKNKTKKYMKNKKGEVIKERIVNEIRNANVMDKIKD